MQSSLLTRKTVRSDLLAICPGAFLKISSISRKSPWGTPSSWDVSRTNQSAALFQGATNVSLQYSRYYTRGFGEDFSAPRYLLDESWTWERYVNGETINYPHLSEGDVTNKHNYQNSTFWTRDASYIRLKNLEIGYTFSGRLLKAARISSARIFVNGNNLFTWSRMLPGIDPETGQQSTNQEAYPVTKTYNIGFTIKF